MNELLQALLDEQRKTNHLLLMLIEALADEGVIDEEKEHMTYLDGTPVR